MAEQPKHIKEQEERIKAFWENETKRIRTTHEAWAKAKPDSDIRKEQAEEEQRRRIAETLADNRRRQLPDQVDGKTQVKRQVGQQRKTNAQTM